MDKIIVLNDGKEYFANSSFVNLGFTNNNAFCSYSFTSFNETLPLYFIWGLLFVIFFNSST